jgi:hypothetical protein
VNLPVNQTPKNPKKHMSRLAVASSIIEIICLISILFILLSPLNRVIPKHFVPLFALPNIIAVFLGIIAVKNIRTSSNLKGMGCAISGLLLGSFLILAGLIWTYGLIEGIGR